MTEIEVLDASIKGNRKGVLLTARIFAREAHRLAVDDVSIVGSAWVSFEPRMLMAALDPVSTYIIEPTLGKLSPDGAIQPPLPESACEYEADGVFVRASLGRNTEGHVVLTLEVCRE